MNKSRQINKIFILCLLTILFSILYTTIKVDASRVNIIVTNKDDSPVVTKIEGKTIYATPEGKFGNTGTEESPYDVTTGIMRLTAGDTLILKDGVYRVPTRIRIEKPQSGNFASYINVIAENVNKVTLDFSLMKFDGSNRGIQIDADYWYFYGINIKGAGDNGMYIGGNFNKIEMCMFYENRDTGLQLGRSDGSFTNIKDWPHNNLIKNCTSFNNYDDETYGENADGFAAKLTVGEGNVFDGCIAYRNSDDGWDTYAKSDSGNVGLTVIRNCLSFENGWTLTPHLEDWQDPNSSLIYNTRDGDGIGFKLGGSSMEGSVLVENCLSFNNKLGGFSDNSNPGVISIRNCTAYNNSVTVKSNGSFGPSDGNSVNFDMARKNMSGSNSDSYNNYYGLLSYATNYTDPIIAYTSGDDYKGACGYSIFAQYSVGDKKIKYYTFTNYQDGNSYESDKRGTEYLGVMNDQIFANIGHSWTTNDNTELHYLLRNSDGSINAGDTLNIVNPDLLTYCEGKQIGANLTKTSWDQYDHFISTQPVVGIDTVNSAKVLSAYDVLNVMCNPVAVFQDVKLLTLCNECQITWQSSDNSILAIGSEETKSLSSLTYVWGKLYRSRSGNKEITLTATISYGGVSKTKEFKLNIMKDMPAIGNVTGYQDKYILDQYGVWKNPSVEVSNYSSNSGLSLVENVDYIIEPTYKYAINKNAPYYDVSDVYTSVPGVYEVSYNIKSLINENDKLTTSFYVFISSSYSEIDLSTVGSGISFHVCPEGVNINAELSATSGNMYVYTSDQPFATADAVKEHGTIYPINDEKINITVENENKAGYYLYVVFVNKANTYTSKVYSSKVSLKSVTTCEEFYNFVISETSTTTIYSLENDLDFKNYTWKETIHTNTFGGLFDGNNHTIANITIKGTSPKNVNIFYKVSGGTIINCKFDNISLTGDGNSTTKVAIVGQMCDGYIDNIELTNISAYAYQGAAAMVGQVCGGVNYINRVSLVNDENATITVTGKYCGGMVGNLQKDSSELQCELYVDNCYVNAVIGGKSDTGGYSGGIVGRYKNDFEVCVLSVSHCVVYGKIMTGKNYAGGITGGCDNGLGKTIIECCCAEIVLYYAGTDIDGINAPSVKNGSPIIGRQTLGTGIYQYGKNYGSFADYNYGVSDADEFDIKKYREYMWKTALELDIVNQWVFDKTTGTVSLKHN